MLLKIEIAVSLYLVGRRGERGLVSALCQHDIFAIAVETHRVDLFCGGFDAECIPHVYFSYLRFVVGKITGSVGIIPQMLF